MNLEVLNKTLRPITLIIERLQEHLRPLRKSVEEVEKSLLYQVLLSHQKARSGVNKVINDDNLSLVDKIKILPKIDPDIHLSFLLLEILVQKKLETSKFGSTLWKEFSKRYRTELDKLFMEGYYKKDTWFMPLFSLCEEGPLESVRNVIVHEIGGRQLAFMSCVNDVSIDNMDKIYNFIRDL